MQAAHESGASVALDTSGPALRAGLPQQPDLVKPNREELAEAVGRDVATLADVVDASRLLLASGAASVLCSLGPDGAVYVDSEVALHAVAPITDVRNTVGAGDALLAGYLRAVGRGPLGALRMGVAWATAAVGTAGTGVPTPDSVDVSQVRVVDVLQSPNTLNKELV